MMILSEIFEGSIRKTQTNVQFDFQKDVVVVGLGTAGAITLIVAPPPVACGPDSTGITSTQTKLLSLAWEWLVLQKLDQRLEFGSRITTGIDDAVAEVIRDIGSGYFSMYRI